MKKTSKESIIIARHISCFFNEYAPSQKTDSIHTLRAYQTAQKKKCAAKNLAAPVFKGELLKNGLSG